MPISSEENAVLESLSVKDPWRLVEEFASQPRWRPEDVDTGAEMIAAHARGLGLPVEMLDANIHLSVPHEASVEIGGQTFRAKPPSLSKPVPEGLAAPLLYIRANPKALRLYSRDVRDAFGDSYTDWDDFRSRIAGKILVTEGFGNPALTSLVEEMGAVGLIVCNPGQNIHWGTSSLVWGSPGLGDRARLPKIPVVAVNKPDGERIKTLADGRADVTIRSRLQVGWFPQKIPTVLIPGTEEPERFILVHGHYDSWDVGVGDNATGDAVLLGLADGLWRNRERLRRSVRVAWWPGHSTGRYSGSTWYADNFALDLSDNCVATVNCDSPGCRWATSYHRTTCMSELHEFVSDVIGDVTGSAPQFIRPKRAGDASFLNLGISSYFSLSSTMPDALAEEKGYYEVSGCGGNIAWHTEDDTMEIADRDILLTDLKIYTLAALRHATSERLPSDFRATLKEFAATIAAYKKASGSDFDWSAVEAATDRLADAVSRFYDAPTTPAEANDVILRLTRILVPLNFAHEGRFSQDPAIVRPALPDLAAALELPKLSGEEMNFALTDLRRGANRYVAALRDAAKLLDGTERRRAAA